MCICYTGDDRDRIKVSLSEAEKNDYLSHLFYSSKAKDNQFILEQKTSLERRSKSHLRRTAPYSIDQTLHCLGAPPTTTVDTFSRKNWDSNRPCQHETMSIGGRHRLPIEDNPWGLIIDSTTSVLSEAVVMVDSGTWESLTNVESEMLAEQVISEFAYRPGPNILKEAVEMSCRFEANEKQESWQPWKRVSWKHKDTSSSASSPSSDDLAENKEQHTDSERYSENSLTESSEVPIAIKVWEKVKRDIEREDPVGKEKEHSSDIKLNESKLHLRENTNLKDVQPQKNVSVSKDPSVSAGSNETTTLMEEFPLPLVESKMNLARKEEEKEEEPKKDDYMSRLPKDTVGTKSVTEATSHRVPISETKSLEDVLQKKIDEIKEVLNDIYGYLEQSEIEKQMLMKEINLRQGELENNEVEALNRILESDIPNTRDIEILDNAILKLKTNSRYNRT